MTPIVNGIEAEFASNINFEYLNALDNGIGEATFDTLNLPGHPSYVVFDADGEEIYRGFGILTADQLREALEGV